MPYNSGKNAESKDNTLRPPKSKRSETQAKYQLGSLGTEGRLRFRPDATQRERAGGGHPSLGATSGRGVTEHGTPRNRRVPVTVVRLLPHISGIYSEGSTAPKTRQNAGKPLPPAQGGGRDIRTGQTSTPPGTIHENPTTTFARVRAETVPQDINKERSCVPKSLHTATGRAGALMGRHNTQEREPEPQPQHRLDRTHSVATQTTTCCCVNGQRRGTGSAVHRCEPRPTDCHRPGHKPSPHPGSRLQVVSLTRPLVIAKVDLRLFPRLPWPGSEYGFPLPFRF